jgi:hypothetical protein
MQKNKLNKKILITIIILLIMFLWLIIPETTTLKEAIPTFAVPPKIFFSEPKEDPKTKPLNLKDPDIQRMKTEGCVADGLLSGYNRTSKDIKVVNESECYYLHRAIETWLAPPDFHKINKIKKKIKKDDLLYGMFIAEAIDKKSNYAFIEEDRAFDFSEMCRDNSKNYWGEHSCKPSFSQKEYRAYVKQITEEAIDNGIQVFLFGQIFYQEENIAHPRYTKEVVQNIRDYAKKRGVKVMIGAQTNDITDESYLRIFDFIEGGVGLHSSGAVEDNACYSRWWKKEGDWCWALLWNDKFKSKANNVLVHLDWSGVIGDDMSTFTRMNENKRHQVLINLHQKFTTQGVGFLMPILTPLHKENGGCHGPKKSFYSPSMKYSCKDLDIINEIIE